MLVLGIETSCDETAVSIVKDGKFILSHIVSSSLKFHKKYGGVIPEIASRIQLEIIGLVLDNALRQAKVKLRDIHLISVTQGPGLKGSLLVGICLAKALSYSLGIPLVGVNHLYAHLYAAFLKPQKQNASILHPVVFPFIGLVISGGHTSLFYVKDFNAIKLLGETLDDACGEAFDKVAKILGFGYPGGPLIEKLAKKGNPRKVSFGSIRTRKPLDFSFSGIKTAVLYTVNKNKCFLKTRKSLTIADKKDIAAAFQETVFNTLIQKAYSACRMKQIDRLVIGGGVAANNRLREKFNQEKGHKDLKVYFAAKEFCTDNAAMVAGLGYILFKKGLRDNLDLTVRIN